MASKKEVFNPFPRMGRYAAPLLEGVVPTNPVAAEFTDTVLQVFPPLPKTEVSLRIQFRCSVPLVEGDTVTLTLPGFKGAPQSFAPEPRPHPDGFNAAECFRAYWSGDAKPKGKKLKGVPAKQTILFQVVRRMEESQLVTLGVPFSVGLLSPDKQPANSAKLKIEGTIKAAEEGKVPKQTIITSTEIKKEAITDELDIYGKCITRVMDEGNITAEDHHISESLSQEELDQLWMAVQQRPPYAVNMPFTIAVRAFHEYEDAGGFIKTLMEAAISYVRAKDPLAVHREVARNWGVKEAAVVLLEDLLATQCGGYYPEMSRTVLLVCCLITMEPADVIRVFGLTGPLDKMPSCSILQEVQSAFRSYDALVKRAVDDTGSSPTGNANDAVTGNSTKSLKPKMEYTPPQVYSERCERLVKKWGSVLACLLTTTYITQEPKEESQGNDTGDRRQPVVTFDTNDNNKEKEYYHLLAPPPLYVAIRDLPTEELNYLQAMQSGDWYMFPYFLMAREHFPPIERIREEKTAAAAAAAAAGGAAGPTALKLPTENKEDTSTNHEDEDDNNDNDGDDYIPVDDAVVFELRNVLETMEMADVSIYPNNREWLLPFGASFRVVSVEVHQALQKLTHVVLTMEGSVAGGVGDDFIPQGDRNVAGMVKGKVLSRLEQSHLYTTHIAQLIYLYVKLQNRKRQHAPTLIRAQYLSHYHTVQRATQAKDAIEGGYVLWQVQTQPPSYVEEGVVRPASWETVPAKFLEKIELFFLERNKSRLLLEEGTDAKSGPTLVFNLDNYTITYGGRDPRPVRRVVGGYITHEPVTIACTQYDEMNELHEECDKKILALKQKLGLVDAPEKAKKEKKAAGGKKAAKKKK